MMTDYLLQLIVLLLPVPVLPHLGQCWSPVKALVLELLQCCLPLLAVSLLEGAPALFASSSMFSVQAWPPNGIPQQHPFVHDVLLVVEVSWHRLGTSTPFPVLCLEIYTLPPDSRVFLACAGHTATTLGTVPPPVFSKRGCCVWISRSGRGAWKREPWLLSEFLF